MNLEVIFRCTLTTNSFAVVYANINSVLKGISRPKAEGDAIEVYKYLKGIYSVDSSRIFPLAGPKTFERRGHRFRKAIARQN